MNHFNATCHDIVPRGRHVGLALLGLWLASANLVGCTGRIGADGASPLSSVQGEPAPPSTNGLPSNTTEPADDCSEDVPTVPLLRLTREQYAHSLRDILRLDSVPVDSLSPDETAGPFQSNGVSSVGDLLAEQYMESAETLARAGAKNADVMAPCDHVASGDAGCASTFIDRVGRRLYRRKLSVDERARYTDLYAKYAPMGYAEGVRLVLQSMLQSPHFLYHVELDGGAGSSGGAGPLPAFQLASRLSFFLWNSSPDDDLLDAAAAGGLDDERGLTTQIERMSGDGKASDALASFYLQWLGLTSVESASKDPSVYPSASPAVLLAMKEETKNFANYVMREADGRLSTLLTSPTTTAADVLLPLYGITRPAVADSRVQLSLPPSQRSGILTQLAFLTAHAHTNQSSPVQRGVVIRRNVLCQPLPDPPPNVKNEAPSPAADATTRERFAAHEKDPSCGGCHKLIDGVGFGFENYDGVGSFRAREGGKDIDSSGTLLQTRDLDGPFRGAVELSRKLANSEEVSSCFSQQWYRYALGRLEAPEDACSLRRIGKSFRTSSGDMRKLLVDIALAAPFRNLRPASP